VPIKHVRVYNEYSCRNRYTQHTGQGDLSVILVNHFYLVFLYNFRAVLQVNYLSIQIITVFVFDIEAYKDLFQIQNYRNKES